jgi:ribosomal protein S21
MGIRIRLHDGESIAQALRRFKQLLTSHGWVWQRGHSYFVPRTQLRRKKRFQKRFKGRQATLLAQMASEQPVVSLVAAAAKFWRRTGKP